MTTHPTISDLKAAADTLGQRGDQWSKNACLDMASKLLKYGKYASDKQAAFFASKVAAANSPPSSQGLKGVLIPNLVRLMHPQGKFAKITYQALTISTGYDQASLWIKWNGLVRGKVNPGADFMIRFPKHDAPDAFIATLIALDASPKEILSAEGRATGTCCCCGRPLTNPESIAAGIGPICAAGF